MWERDVPLAPRARYRIGGPASRFARVETRAELLGALRDLAGAPHLVLGTGANTLISDRGVDEAVLVLGGELDTLAIHDEAIEAGAAAKLPALAGAARRSARAGYDFLEAVPGTVGGGLRMNAGSRDRWLWHLAEWAEAVTPGGETVRIGRDEAGAGYRSVAIPESWVFVAARFRTEPGEAELVHQAHMAFRRQKVDDQVYELPSIGSTWKNPGPPHGSAWEVVDRVGMRGARVGDAQIAERHANFIVNLGEARADDVLELMSRTRSRAYDALGVWLEPEIRMWGFEPERLAAVGAA